MRHLDSVVYDRDYLIRTANNAPGWRHPEIETRQSSERARAQQVPLPREQQIVWQCSGGTHAEEGRRGPGNARGFPKRLGRGEDAERRG